MRKGDLVRLEVSSSATESKLTARPWLRNAQRQLGRLLPREHPSALITEQLVDDSGKPVDVLKHFHLRREGLERLSENCDGLAQTGQLSGSDFAGGPPPQWPGFNSVWVPLREGLSLFGLMGLSLDEHGKPREADCIVLLPGILGHTDIRRTRDLALALVQNGFHALAIELRGHGQTDMKYPDVFYTFGVQETDDLLMVSEWLESQPHVRKTGLIGFCWGANQALLCAWDDGRPPSHASISARLQPHLNPRRGRRHYEAGVMAFSPTLRFEEIFDSVDVERAGVDYPVQANLQVTVEKRVAHKQHNQHDCFDPSACPGSLRKLIDYEFARSELGYPGSVDDALRFVRFLPYKGKDDGVKLNMARVPVLIVQGANDPLAIAQDVADLISKTPNPNVAAIVLPGGGHVGFAAYARTYYFSLILNFFNAETGPKAISPSQAR